MGIQSWLDKSKPEDYRNSKAGKAYENIGLPILAVLETIASQGRSPGTVALAQQDRLYNARRQFEQDQQTAKEKALAQKVQAGQLDEITRKSESAAQQEARMKAYREKLGLPGVNADQEAEAYLRENDPKGYLDYKEAQKRANKPDWWQQQEYLQNKTKRLSPTEIEGLSGARSSLSVLEKAAEKFNPNWAKPWVGQTLQNIMAKSDKDRAAFESTIKNFSNELLKARSGAAVTEPEYNRFLAEIGDLNQTADSWYAKVNEMHALLTSRYNQKLEDYGTANLDVSKFTRLEPKSFGVSKTDFKTEEEAAAAGLKPGAKITIGGRPAVWE